VSGPTAAASAILARWDALMRTVEVPYAAAILTEKNRYIDESAAAFPSTQRLEDRLFDVHAGHIMVLAEKYQGIAIRLGLHEMSKGLKGRLPTLERKEDWEKLWLYLVRQWVSSYGAARARETAQTTRDDMQAIIDQSLAEDTEFNPQQVATALLRAKEL
jgi:hypothetical protein